MCYIIEDEAHFLMNCKLCESERQQLFHIKNEKWQNFEMSLSPKVIINMITIYDNVDQVYCGTYMYYLHCIWCVRQWYRFITRFIMIPYYIAQQWRMRSLSWCPFCVWSQALFNPLQYLILCCTWSFALLDPLLYLIIYCVGSFAVLDPLLCLIICCVWSFPALDPLLCWILCCTWSFAVLGPLFYLILFCVWSFDVLDPLLYLILYCTWSFAVFDHLLYLILCCTRSFAVFKHNKGSSTAKDQVQQRIKYSNWSNICSVWSVAFSLQPSRDRQVCPHHEPSEQPLPHAQGRKCGSRNSHSPLGPEVRDARSHRPAVVHRRTFWNHPISAQWLLPRP